MDQNEIQTAVETLEKLGYKVHNPEPNADKIIEALEAQGFTVTKAKEETESETKEDDEKQTESETKQTQETTEETDTKHNITQFFLGTPPDKTETDTELTEEKILAMTPEQMIEKHGEVREFVLANGGNF